MILGCLCESAGSRSSITGSALSSSMSSRRASMALALAAARVDGRPFSAIGPTVIPRVLQSAESQYQTVYSKNSRARSHHPYLVHACTPPYFRNAQ